jgi:putative MFS transporter
MSLSVTEKRSIPARIDRLPLSLEIWRILFLAGVAWLLESYDIGVIGTVLPTLEQEFHPDTFLVGLLATASTLGIVVAIIPAGWLADRIGRKNMLIAGIAWFSIFSFLCGFAPNLTVIVILRFIAGFGMGAIFPIPYAMAAELTPRRLRGMTTGILDSFLSVGYFAAPLLGFALTPLMPEDLAWRTLLLIGGVPLLFVPVLMKWMPESPRWLQVQGRDDEADSIVAWLETRAEQRSGQPLPAPKVVLQQLQIYKVSPRGIVQKPYVKSTAMMWIAFACILFIFYAIQTYTPSVLVKQGYTLNNAFLLTSIIVIASIPGKYAAAYALERWGRKATLIVFTLIAALSAVIFGLTHSEFLSLAFGIVMSFFGIGVDPGIKIYGAEQYPTSVRAFGVSSFECIGRFFGGVLAPFIMAFILAQGGTPGSYLFVAIVALAGILTIVFLGTETKGQSIEQTAERR